MKKPTVIVCQTRFHQDQAQLLELTTFNKAAGEQHVGSFQCKTHGKVENPCE